MGFVISQYVNFVKPNLNCLFFSMHFIYLKEMWAADARVGPEGGQLTYDDFEPLTSVQIPPILTGAEPARLENIYRAFLSWVGALDDVRIHLRDFVDCMEENLIYSQMLALRLAVMSQFYMRHPRYEISHRR